MADHETTARGIVSGSAYHAFWRAFVDLLHDSDWSYDQDVEGLLEEAKRLGLIEQVLYDPDAHGEIDAEPGDFIWHLTALGLAAPPTGEKG